MSREAGREKETRVTAIVRVSTAEIAQILNAIICYILAMFSAHLCLLSSWVSSVIGVSFMLKCV